MEILYNVMIGCVKFSVLLFYHRLFPSKRFQRVSYTVAALLAAWFIACTIVSVTECVPIHAFWDVKTEGSCIHLKHYILANAIPNIVTDLILMALPLPTVWSLQLVTARKILLSGVFLLGLL